MKTGANGTVGMRKVLPATNHLLCSLAMAMAVALAQTARAGEMQASDGLTDDLFGFTVSVSGTIGLVGAPQHDLTPNGEEGTAYLFRDLNTANGTILQNAKLIASNPAVADLFGCSVSVYGTTGLVGAVFDDDATTNQGSAYLYKNLHLASGITTPHATLQKFFGGPNDDFGWSVSLHGTTGLIGARYADFGANGNQGLAYVFRNLHTAAGVVNEDASLRASDGLAQDEFGWSVSIHGTRGLVGARRHDISPNGDEGAAYLFRDLNTLTGTNTENAKLVASDVAINDFFGNSVALYDTIGLVGAYQHDVGANNDQGAAYLYHNMHIVAGTTTENAKLLASDGTPLARFGYAVSLSGTTGLVGAPFAHGSSSFNGAAYVFRNLDTANGTMIENVKIFASNGMLGDVFGFSVSLDGDRFVSGAISRDIGTNINAGSAYFGHLRTFTTADLGSDATATDGLSFEARDNWIIGQTTSNNSVTLTSGDTGNVGRVGLVNPTTAQTYIGQNAGSNNNTLHVESGATLTSNSINVGASNNSGNQLRANGTINLSSSAVLDVFDGNILSGAGTIQGHAGNTTNSVVISGSLRPGSGNLGAGIGTLTRNDGDVTWNGNASSPWVFELGIAQPTLALANTGGTRDLLDITSGNFLKGSGSSFVFDFAGTGSIGWYKLVDWTGTTDFVASDFTASNLAAGLLAVGFTVDPATTALYIELALIPEPQVWAMLCAVLGALIMLRQRLRKSAKTEAACAS